MQLHPVICFWKGLYKQTGAVKGDSEAAPGHGGVVLVLTFLRWTDFWGCMLEVSDKTFNLIWPSLNSSSWSLLWCGAPVIKLKCFSAGMKGMEGSGAAGQTFPTAARFGEGGFNLLFPPPSFVRARVVQQIWQGVIELKWRPADAHPGESGGEMWL